MKSTLKTQIAMGYLVAALLMIVVGAVPFRSLVSIDRTDDWVTHTYDVLDNAENAIGALKGTQAAMLGYALSGSDAWSALYRDQQDSVRSYLAQMRSLTGDDAVQQRRLDRIEPMVAALLDGSAQVLDKRRREGAEAAARGVADGHGQETLDQVRGLLDEFERDERRNLKERSDESNRTSEAARSTIVLGTLAAIAAMVAAGWWITRSLSARVSAAVQQIQNSAAELQSAASEQATASTEQKAATTEASTTLKELVATSRQMAESAQRVTGIAEETASTARSGDATVQRAQEAINGIKRQVDQIVGHMLELGRKSQQVGGVLDLINELAEQTNILAINATIESAGAGEAGRRFAVVADEVRKLADRVGGSTKEVRVLIDDIRASANTTVMATEDGVKSVDAGTRQFGEVTNAIGRVADRVLTTTDASREIELGTRQQVTAVEQCSTALSGIAQASAQNEIATRQTADTAAQLVRLAVNLQQLIGAGA